MSHGAVSLYSTMFVNIKARGPHAQTENDTAVFHGRHSPPIDTQHGKEPTHSYCGTTTIIIHVYRKIELSSVCAVPLRGQGAGGDG